MSSPASAAPGSVQREAGRISSGTANASREQGRQDLAQNDIAQLAYALWQRRGCPDGNAEQDWLEAEAQLRK
jgi:Protein of unknown function (DUF2934)